MKIQMSDRGFVFAKTKDKVGQEIKLNQSSADMKDIYITFEDGDYLLLTPKDCADIYDFSMAANKVVGCDVEIHLYDMVIVEDEIGNIWQECVNAVHHGNKYETPTFEIEVLEDGRIFCQNKKIYAFSKLTVTEIWTRTFENIYYKVYGTKFGGE